MNLSNDSEEILPLYEIIAISPSTIADHGDVFKCGRCKQLFFSILDFISHKKDHSLDHRMNGCNTNVISISQPSNEVWLLKNNNLEVNGIEDISKLNNKDLVENDYSMLQNNSMIAETINDKPEHNSPLFLIADKEMEESVNSLSCYTCGGCFETNNDLAHDTHHNISSDSQSPIKPISTVCKTQKNEKRTYIRKTLVKTKDSYFQCIVCGGIFQKKSLLKKHLTSHKVWPDGINKAMLENSSAGDDLFVCSYCHVTFENYADLRRHVKKHDHQKVFKCIQSKCKAMFVDLESLLSHISIDHNIVEYHCNLCSNITSSLDEMAQHYHSNLHADIVNKPIYQCVHCKATFKNNERLKHHLDTVNHINKCTHCGKHFVSERLLRKHLPQHNDYASYKCDICKASFKLKHYLLSHMVTHNVDKEFSCTSCFKNFKRKDLLTRHMKLHQPDKKRECPFKNESGCTLKFTRSDKLNQHIKTHEKKNDLGPCTSLEIFVVNNYENSSVIQ